jgi:two-component system phosphate regulon sensor histidine kinase PhoR
MWEFDQMVIKIEEMTKLISSKEQKKAIALSCMDDGVIITNSQGIVDLVNPAAERLLHLPGGKAIGRPFIEVVGDYELTELLSYCLKTGEPQTKLLDIGTDRRSFRVRVTSMAGDGPAGGLVVLQDLTELQRLERVRRDFMANISHELRTPLTSIKGLIETLQGGAIEDPLAAKIFLERANVETDKLNRLLQELEELSWIESGQATMNMEPQDIVQLMTQVAERFQIQADRAGLELTINAPARLPRVLADGEQIERVIVNLLHNAIKFTPPGGQISLKAEQDGETIAVSVTDTGRGIPAEDMPHIFERFYKVDKARATEGTGLGLAIAKHIIQSHQGNIWATSTMGEGSTFTFSLPLAPAKP